MKYKVIKEFPESQNPTFNQMFKKDNILVPQFTLKRDKLDNIGADYIKIVTKAQVYPTQPPHSITLNLNDLAKKGYLEKIEN